MGLTKPWITPYAGERYEGRFGFDGQQIFYAPGEGEPRDDDGILWQPSLGRCQHPGCRMTVDQHDRWEAGHEIDLGEIWWKEMHTGRQRDAMRGPLCQVCGTNLSEAKPLLWLLPALELMVRKPNGRPFTTSTPPICATCVDVARQQCPNLKANAPLLLQVQHYRPWGVFGDTVRTRPVQRLVQGDVQLGTEEIKRTMARHLVVEILDYRKVRS